MNLNFLKCLLGRRKNTALTLRDCFEKGLLTKEEFLRITKDRMIKEWEAEVSKDTKKATKRKR